MKREIYNYYEKERKAFEGYKVPEKLKKIASLIMFRFNIDGICDGMYLCNIMANHSGSGDGCGTFVSEHVEPRLAAEVIQSAYGCNISKNNMNELTNIISEIDLGNNVVANMEISASRLKEELKQIQDEFRISYLKKQIHEYEEKIAWIEKMNGIEREIMVFEIGQDTFRIFGKFEIMDAMDENKKGYTYPVFRDLRAEKKSTDGSCEPYRPTNVCWGGRKFDERDMIYSVVDSFILGNDMVSVLKMDKEMEEWLCSYRDDASVEVNGKKIPWRVFDGLWYDCMSLFFVTDEYIYYSSCGEIRMYDAKGHRLCSDNWFAENGYWESCENVVNGTEVLLWGNLPDEYKTKSE